MADKKLLDKQVALVTGSSSGIGKAVATAFAKAGASVVIDYHSNKEAAEVMVEEIKAGGGNAICVGVDVSKEAEVQQMFRQIFDAFGTIDILVNNSGIQQDAAFHEMTLEQWQRVIDVNLTGQFLCSREAVREFMRRGIDQSKSIAAGKIICISSVHEIIPWAGHVNYASSKGGIMMLMKSMAQELAPYKIRVNSIAPGAIQTPINKSAWETKERLDKLLTLIPYNRIGQPEDVARLAVWLASDEADYITGQTMVIDGGMTLYPGFSTNG